MILIYVIFDSYMLYTYLLSICMVLYEIIYDISSILTWMDSVNHAHQVLQKNEIVNYNI